MKFFIGPMSKTIVDTILELGDDITFIPSRRQIDYNGGYIGWTTEEFARHVNGRAKIERDHGGPGQGSIDDDGYTSLREDCKYFDIIHIDPWKKYPDYSDGLRWTIDMIEFCAKHSSTVRFEVGTEEAIRRFTCSELNKFLDDLKQGLEPELFDRITYVVVQCGTQLCEKKNIGSFDENRLKEMLDIVERHGKIAKEHNGDWVSVETIRDKERIGLKNVNIAPEVGENETRVLMKHMHKDRLFQICLESEKWKKWVPSGFDPYANKEDIILICGHYVNLHPEVAAVRDTIRGELRKAVCNMFYEKTGVYSERKSCIFCQSSDLKTLLENDKETPICFSLYQSAQKSIFIPFNIQVCTNCQAAQIKYIGDPRLIYANNHIDTYGTTKKRMFDAFSSFVAENKSIQSIIEVGGSTDALARRLCDRYSYTIIDPSFSGNRNGIAIIDSFIENVDIGSLQANTIVLSNVFEHIYDPAALLRRIYDAKQFDYILLNHPDMEHAMKNMLPVNLNVEHTFYTETHFLLELFSKHGFSVTRKDVYGKNHTLMLEFSRTSPTACLPKNMSSSVDIHHHAEHILSTIEKIHTAIRREPSKTYYMWPSSTHSIIYFIWGLDYTLFKGMLDNSPNKIGKVVYGYNLPCLSFKEIVERNDPNDVIVLSGSEDYRNEIYALYPNSRFLVI